MASCWKSMWEMLMKMFRDQQVSTSYPAVFCGKVVAAYRECLIINCAYVGKGGKRKWAIPCSSTSVPFVSCPR